jgi:endonuclease YncB( thermonuclease family)
VSKVSATSSPYVYDAQLVRIVDADTAIFELTKVSWLEIDFGFKIKTRSTVTNKAEVTIRFYGINAPEKITPAGKAAVEALTKLLEANKGNLKVRTYKPDKYGGRYLGEILIPKNTDYLTHEGVEADLTEAVNVNAWLVEQGHAKVYFGEGVKPE